MRCPTVSAENQLEAVTGLESRGDLHVLGDLQTLNVEALRTPPQITTFIKQQKQTALDLTRGRHSEKGLTSFCANMDGLLSRPGLRMDYIHFSAIITAAAHVQKLSRVVGLGATMLYVRG